MKVNKTLTNNFLLFTKNFQNVVLNTKTKPPDFSSQLISFVPPVLFDFPGMGGEFGNCIKQPPRTIRRGEKVSATFVCDFNYSTEH